MFRPTAPAHLVQPNIITRNGDRPCLILNNRPSGRAPTEHDSTSVRTSIARQDGLQQNMIQRRCVLPSPVRAGSNRRAILLLHRVHLLGATAEDRAVSTRVFGGIHGIVGKTKQFLIALRSIRSRGNANTQ